MTPIDGGGEAFPPRFGFPSWYPDPAEWKALVATLKANSAAIKLSRSATQLHLVNWRSDSRCRLKCRFGTPNAEMSVLFVSRCRPFSSPLSFPAALGANRAPRLEPPRSLTARLAFDDTIRKPPRRTRRPFATNKAANRAIGQFGGYFRFPCHASRVCGRSVSPSLCLPLAYNRQHRHFRRLLLATDTFP